ncbi:MAG: formylglycine-generating enzyme family protein [Spirochaetaceae bacterium]|jgi:formylglycine-generating enzyme required for sulfatase activity|nr:formylglycine-generating enzyme family protein [Spirochaetaceae bacterium]
MKMFLLFSFTLFAAVSAVAQNRFPSDFVLIKGGIFTMGSPASEPERGTDETQHRVTVGDFYIAKSSVTQREYSRLMGNNPSEFKGDNLPVENVTWFDAVRFCNALSMREGLTPAYTISGEAVTWNRNANGYRLPTEAEWEYACRAGTTTPFNIGNNITDKEANCYNNYGYNNNSSGRVTGGYRGRTTPINSYTANNWGLFDMHGNAADWCWDWYGEYGANAKTNPTGPAAGTLRVNRGGGWNDFPKHIRSAYRAATPPGNYSFNLGFRLARTPEKA